MRESQKKYPDVHVSDGEYVIAQVRRHPIGLLGIWVADLFVAGLVIALAVFLQSQAGALANTGINVNSDALLLILALVTLVVLLIGFIGATIYNDNKFYVTNESVIQHIRTGLFSSREQVISLGGVEDASFVQHGVLQYLLGYGSIRLSTVGDETTYQFTIVEDPKDQLQTLNDAVEVFKRENMYEGNGAKKNGGAASSADAAA